MPRSITIEALVGCYDRSVEERRFVMPLRLFAISLAVRVVLLPLGVAETMGLHISRDHYPGWSAHPKLAPPNYNFLVRHFRTSGHSYSVEFEPPADNSLSAMQHSRNSARLPFSVPPTICKRAVGLPVVGYITQNSGYASVSLRTEMGQDAELPSRR